MSELLHCQRCTSFTTVLLRTLLNHYNTTHKNEVNFFVVCDVKNCQLSFTKYNSYYKHVRAHHKDLHDLKYVEDIAKQSARQEEEESLNNSQNCPNESYEYNQSYSEDSDECGESEESFGQVADTSMETGNDEEEENQENCFVSP